MPSPSPSAPLTAVLYTWEVLGHLNPALQLAELFRRRGYAVTLVVARLPAGTGPSPDAVAAAVASHPAISTRLLPPPDLHEVRDSGDGMVYINSIRLGCPRLLALLRSRPGVALLVLDNFCVDAVDVGRDAGVPVYIFNPSAAASLAVFLHWPVLHATLPTSFKDMGNTPVHVPGTPAIRASDMPALINDRSKQYYKARTAMFARMAEADGFLVNSFEWLEKRAVAALRAGKCVAPGQAMPPVFCAGPIIADGDGESRGSSSRHECPRWLDGQPDGSVVFLCFGSGGSFSAAQLKEIAVGLERSGQRFLWVVKSPKAAAGEDSGRQFEPRPEPELRSLLPEGFLERTAGVGKVVKSWAPQSAVLAHGAVGAFVTHCGWNSVLEAVALAGVPLLCWPLYAEQRMNKTFLVEEKGLGVEMEGYDGEVVSGEEVAAKVKWVMESEEGKEMRRRAATAKEKAAEAVADGGPSAVAFEEFLAHAAGHDGRSLALGTTAAPAIG